VASLFEDGPRLTVQAVGFGIMGVIALAAGVKRVAGGACRSFAANQDCYVFFGIGLICLGAAAAFLATARHVSNQSARGLAEAERCARCGRSYPPEAMSRLSSLHAIVTALSGFSSTSARGVHCRRCRSIMDASLVGLGLAAVAGVTNYLGWW